MSGCSFSSMWDVYDGGIVPSLNSPSSSLTASNSSFVRCYRSGNIAISGSEGNPSKPGRQNQTDNGANSFTWCVWNGSKTTGTSSSYSDGISSGGAIYMYNLGSGTLSVKCCSFSGCEAYYSGGGIHCYNIKSVEIENNSFSACSSETSIGGGLCVLSISACVRISGCEFQKCSAKHNGGGLFLNSFDVSGSGCIGTESGKGESACVFECFFTSCSLTNTAGGGMYCQSVPAAFKMRSIQFISCSATAYGGGMRLYPFRQTAPDDGIYCYFLFFHECKCSANPPYGHDVMYYDKNNLYISQNNPFYECYTTNTDEQRVCYGYNYAIASAWTYDQTSKKDWLKDKTIYVSVNGSDGYELCGANESNPCKTVKKAFEMCEVQISLAITLLDGNHQSEATTIDIGEKKISVIGRGKDKSSIGTGALSSTGALFSVTTGHLGMSHLKVDCNSNASPSSPSVVVVSDGSGSLSLEDVVITTSKTGNYVMSSSVFVVQLSQLSMVCVEIINMNVSKSLFSEPNPSSPSSSSLSSSLSSALYLTSKTSGESMLANLSAKNVKLTEGDGVVVAKSVKEGETFVVQNVTIEDCECEAGSGGGIKVELESSSSKLQVGTSSAAANEVTNLNRCKCNKYGGGMMLYLADNSIDFSIVSVDFTGCSASLGGNYVFVNGSNSASWGITIEKLNVQHDSSKFDELMGYDRSDTTMGLFPLNVFLEAFSGAAHVGIKKNGYGGYNSWFCGFGYFPCSTIEFASQNRFSSSKKNIVLDSGFELGEVVSMAGSYEWEVYCETNKTNVNVRAPGGMTSSYLINIQRASSIKNIAFQIPFLLSSATSLIVLTSSSLTLTDCSVAHMSESTSSVSFGYSIVNVQGGNLKMERFVMEEGLTFNDNSAIEFCEGMTSMICSGCNISGVVKNGGDGGWMKGTVGGSGTLTVDGCNVNGCSCVGGNGGGVHVDVQDSGIAIVNGTARFGGCVSEGGAIFGGKGGGMMAYLEGETSKLMIGSQVRFSEENQNEAMFGKDAFVKCGDGILLKTKISKISFEFFDTSTIPLDPRRLCGTENGTEDYIFPLFVYLCETEYAVVVDGSRGKGIDYPHCGLLKFACQTIEYALMKRGDTPVISICNQSSLTDTALFERNRVRIEGLNGNQAVINIAAVNGSANGSLIKLDVDTEFCGIQFILPSRIKGYNSVFESYHKFLLENVTVSSFSQAVSFTFTTAKAGETMLENVAFHKTIFSGACGFATANSYAILSSDFKSGIEQLSSASNNCIFYIQGGTFKVNRFNCFDSKFQFISVFAFGREFNACQADNVFFENVTFYSSLIINRTSSMPSIKPNISISSFFLRNITKIGNDSLLRLEFVNVSISDSMLCVNNYFAAHGVLVNVSNCTVKMSNCTISGVDNLRSIACNGENQNERQICFQFEGSLLYLRNCSSSIESTTFANSSAGALSVRDGEINLKNVTFLNNTANFSQFNSVRRNILCENSSLSIASFSDESGIRNPDNLREGEYLELWMKNRGCTVSGLMNWNPMEDIETADTELREFPQKAYQFCRPHISEITKSEKGDKMMIHFIGNNLLPCLVSYEVFIFNNSSSSSEKEIISLPFITCTFVSQEEFVVEASKSQLKFTLNSLKGQIFVQAVLKLKEDEVYDSRRRITQLVKTDPVMLQDIISNSNEKVNQTKSTSNMFPWWIVFVAAAGLIVISVVIGQVFARKRRSNDNAFEKL
ncbi:uncharacterized protein MONOS_14007 [Monocercomonoides exilis]|uniref:uncharacterized protein n=1 Tax=Monocercomonoides exilis TaxID=2049356 RepID=UPI00355AB25E|nr:hypothetical protein MONOS_14007 [Monocercomonoides exilis]|eukprot:MONOS_14007.1-p1 / transcript=MONOS_14007.1 / gene=MONOS_14007 / organism=Monocercomonoides_exilis_PA203 / gene_product=unspecified product / transcript_product=unspecified product / location=Mono_scaffold00920:8435-13576(+) / protein_length=1714 / sequence_SO=supercontig / SO=protein_coding / is_pseudo=false